jgi:hypothetical protein
MPNLVYNAFKARIQDGTIDLDTNTIKVMLVTSAYTPSSAHDFRNDITNEVTGAGYTTGGLALANKTVTVVGNSGVFDADNLTWASSTITARGAVIYKDTGNSATDNLIGYVDFVTDQSSSNGDFTIQWNAGGILTLT